MKTQTGSRHVVAVYYTTGYGDNVMTFRAAGRPVSTVNIMTDSANPLSSKECARAVAPNTATVAV